MPFSLYVHIPYCLSKCPYCDFNAYAAQNWPEARYVDALCQEFTDYMQAPPWQGETLGNGLFWWVGLRRSFSPNRWSGFLLALPSIVGLLPTWR